MSQQSPTAVKPETFVLRCEECGKRIEKSLDEAMAYLQLGWPRCCGETMLLMSSCKADGKAKPAK